MPSKNSNQQSQKQSQNVQSQAAKVQVQPIMTKPDKNVAVPKYDLLTKGYDTAKLKKR